MNFIKKTLRSFYSLLPFKHFVFQIVKYIYKPPLSIYQHLHFKGIIKVNIDNNKNFKINHYGYMVENSLFWDGLTGGWEKKSLELWVKLSAISNEIFDIGANTGVYSLISKTINPHAKVYAIEPVDRVFEKLKFNCVLNKFDINCMKLAASDYEGTAIIYDTDTPHTYSVTVNENYKDANVKTIEVPIEVSTIKSIIKKYNIKHIDLMKIDVEKHEVEVLKGMDEYLNIMRPTLLIEILTDEIAQGLNELLSKKGYLFFNIDDQIGAVNISHHLYKSNDFNFNFLCCSKEMAVKLNLI